MLIGGERLINAWCPGSAFEIGYSFRRVKLEPSRPTLAGQKDETSMGKALVFAGLIIAGIGIVIMLGFPLGRLPGDVVFRRGGMTVYVPITTSVLLSIVLTLVLRFVRR